MDVFSADSYTFAIVLLGALLAGVTTGFAGFGTALVSAGFWFHALPAPLVPPLVVLMTAAAQISNTISHRDTIRWEAAKPYIWGGLFGVPFGTWLLSLASPDAIRMTVGVFLIVYVLLQFRRVLDGRVGSWGGVHADRAVGFSGGVMGGFAGLSGVTPLIWLQLRGGPSREQKSIYQPFNLLVAILACIAMTVSGHIHLTVLFLALVCLPCTLAGAWFGARLYRHIPDAVFRNIVLGLLLCSGTVLVWQLF
ncbi:MAG: sulfite exporter TauE/SafE family protein [Pseudomonadota bacterium]